MKFLDFLTKFLGWLQIVASPFLIGFIIGFIIYVSKPDTIGLTIAIACLLIGLIFGIIWANRIWKKGGTVSFISKVRATPELDREEPQKHIKKTD